MKLGSIITLFGLVTLLAGVFAGEFAVKIAESKIIQQPAAIVHLVAGGTAAASAAQIMPINARPSNPLLELLYFLLYLFLNLFRPPV